MDEQWNLLMANIAKGDMATFNRPRFPRGEVRGFGLMLGVELVTDKESKEPATSVTADVVEAAKQRGLLVGKGGLHGNTL